MAQGLRAVVEAEHGVLSHWRTWNVLRPRPIQTTLLDLVHALGAFSDDEEAIVTTIAFLVNRGDVVLRGIYAGQRVRLG